MELTILNISLPLLLLAVSLGLTLPLIGVFVILRRMALLSDALAHVILLGIALAIVLKINIILGIIVFSFLAGLAIFFVREKTKLNLDAVVGVFFTTALALAALLIPSEELLETFLGNLENIGILDVGLALVLAILIIFSLLARFREFAFVSFAPDLAHVSKLNVRKFEFLFLIILSLGIAMGIKLVGTLLISALVIVPAATAKIFSFKIRTMTIWSMVLGLTATLVGLLLAVNFNFPSGPTITLVASAMFLLIFISHSVFKTP